MYVKGRELRTHIDIAFKWRNARLQPTYTIKVHVGHDGRKFILRTDRITKQHSIKLIERTTKEFDDRGQLLCTQTLVSGVGALAQSA